MGCPFNFFFLSPPSAGDLRCFITLSPSSCNYAGVAAIRGVAANSRSQSTIPVMRFAPAAVSASIMIAVVEYASSCFHAKRRAARSAHGRNVATRSSTVVSDFTASGTLVARSLTTRRETLCRALKRHQIRSSMARCGRQRDPVGPDQPSSLPRRCRRLADRQARPGADYPHHAARQYHRWLSIPRGAGDRPAPGQGSTASTGNPDRRWVGDSPLSEAHPRRRSVPA